MTDQPSPVDRRFTIWALVAYVSCWAVLFGVGRSAVLFGVGRMIPSFPVLIAIPLTLMFGALVGLGVAMLVGGRRWAMTGAVVGGINAVVLFVILATAIFWLSLTM